jgi:hypothetical protein
MFNMYHEARQTCLIPGNSPNMVQTEAAFLECVAKALPPKVIECMNALSDALEETAPETEFTFGVRVDTDPYQFIWNSYPELPHAAEQQGDPEKAHLILFLDTLGGVSVHEYITAAQ